LKQILGIVKEIEVHEGRIADIIEKAKKRTSALSVEIHTPRLPRSIQPSLRDLIKTVLSKAGKPLSVREIYEATLAEGYQWRSKAPLNALNVKIYTDRTFKKANPGMFVLRGK